MPTSPSLPPMRPNNIAGLHAKRKQLLKLRKDLERDVLKATCDPDHIDACIRLFDPAADTAAAIQRYATAGRRMARCGGLFWID